MTHPGNILHDEYIKPFGLTFDYIDRELKLHKGTIDKVVKGKRNITPLLAARLAIFFKTTTKYWLDLQYQYDAELKAIKDSKYADEVKYRLIKENEVNSYI